jgi:hypothetical protein
MNWFNNFSGGFNNNSNFGCHGNTTRNRSNESGRYYNYANQFQHYDNFLINGFNPGYEQYAVVGTRNRRRDAEQAIDSIGQQGFWGNFAYPRSLYGIG